MAMTLPASIPSTASLRGADLDALTAAFEQFCEALGLPAEGDAAELHAEYVGVPGFEAVAGWLHRFLGVWEEADAAAHAAYRLKVEAERNATVERTFATATSHWAKRAEELEAQRQHQAKHGRDDVWQFHEFYRGPRA